MLGEIVDSILVPPLSLCACAKVDYEPRLQTRDDRAEFESPTGGTPGMSSHYTETPGLVVSRLLEDQRLPLRNFVGAAQEHDGDDDDEDDGGVGAVVTRRQSVLLNAVPQYGDDVMTPVVSRTREPRK